MAIYDDEDNDGVFENIGIATCSWEATIGSYTVKIRLIANSASYGSPQYSMVKIIFIKQYCNNLNYIYI